MKIKSIIIEFHPKEDYNNTFLTECKWENGEWKFNGDIPGQTLVSLAEVQEALIKGELI